MPSLSHTWSTERLAIRTAVLDEVAELRAAYNACRHLEPLDPTFYEESEEAIRELVARSLARTGDAAERFHLQGVRLRETGELLGYFHLHYHHPLPQTVWISMFVLHPKHQAAGYGGEAVRHLLAQLRSLDAYEAAWLRVYLKNWPALRFWIRSGFTRIIQYDGEVVPAPDAVASLVLAHPLGAAEQQASGAT